MSQYHGLPRIKSRSQIKVRGGQRMCVLREYLMRRPLSNMTDGRSSRFPLWSHQLQYRAAKRAAWRRQSQRQRRSPAHVGKQFAKLPHRYGNSHATWDNTVLPATRQRWHSRPYPSRSLYSIQRPRRDARLSRPTCGCANAVGLTSILDRGQFFPVFCKSAAIYKHRLKQTLTHH